MLEDRIKELFIKLRLELTNDVVNQDDSLIAYDNLRAAYNNLPTNPTFKFAIGQAVYFIKNDKVQTGIVRLRQITESSQNLKEESDYFSRNTDAKVLVLYCLQKGNRELDPNWQVEEARLFASKAELLESL
jgi:hypothetical protein